MTPSPVPPIQISNEQVTQALSNGVIDAFNDPIMHLMIAALVVSVVIGLIKAGISAALRS